MVDLNSYYFFFAAFFFVAFFFVAFFAVFFFAFFAMVKTPLLIKLNEQTHNIQHHNTTTTLLHAHYYSKDFMIFYFFFRLRPSVRFIRSFEFQIT